MCGIAGILGDARPGDRATVLAMNALQNHRGPDASGLRSYEGATLGHTRLSIIDLTAQSAQPMESGDGSAVLTFNGEIYNYKELRRDLASSYTFRSAGDSEVILAAWLKWGEECVHRFNGMFAFCIFDKADRSAFFARDRFGQKPLVLTERQGRLFFASEVKALLAAGIEAKPDFDTWSRYLSAASYDDDASTFFKGVSQLMPGECARWRPDGGLTRRTYYRLADHVERRDVSLTTAIGETRELVCDAARLHMRADVPIAFSLSGGFDSSALLAALDSAKKLHEGVACISVDFGADYSEAKWISAAASHHGLASHIEEFSPSDFRASISPMMWHLEGPIGALMTCALGSVSRWARRRGFRVLQDGTGIDEAFAGYRNHHNLYLGLLLAGGDPGVGDKIRDYARNWGVGEELAIASARAETRNKDTSIDGTIPTRPDLLRTDFVSRHPGAVSRSAFSKDRLKNELIDYLQVRKIPRNTRMKDRTSMAFGIELRLPYLDHRLVEFAISLPTEYYFLHGRTKSIVREAFAGAMDDDVRTAAKRSIQAPQGPWLMTEPMRDYVDGIITSESFADRGLFEVAAVGAAFERFCEGRDANSFFVWQWINVEEWFRTFIDANATAVRAPLCPELSSPQQAAPTGSAAFHPGRSPTAFGSPGPGAADLR